MRVVAPQLKAQSSGRMRQTNFKRLPFLFRLFHTLRKRRADVLDTNETNSALP